MNENWVDGALSGDSWVDYTYFGELDTFSGRRTSAVDTVVIHSTATLSPDVAIEMYRRHRVSAHYLVARDRVYAVVSPDRAAWHAGGGRLADGRDDINSRSIGIELLVASSAAPGYTEEQIALTCDLLALIKGEFEIRNLCSHRAIDRRRLVQRRPPDVLRTDPWKFLHWDRLTAALAPLDISLDI